MSIFKIPHSWQQYFIYAQLIPCNDSYFGFETKQIVEKQLQKLRSAGI